jgi:hypothetical protein
MVKYASALTDFCTPKAISSSLFISLRATTSNPHFFTWRTTSLRKAVNLDRNHRLEAASFHRVSSEHFFKHYPLTGMASSSKIARYDSNHFSAAIETNTTNSETFLNLERNFSGAIKGAGFKRNSPKLSSPSTSLV